MLLRPGLRRTTLTREVRRRKAVPGAAARRSMLAVTRRRGAQTRLRPPPVTLTLPGKAAR